MQDFPDDLSSPNDVAASDCPVDLGGTRRFVRNLHSFAIFFMPARLGVSLGTLIGR